MLNTENFTNEEKKQLLALARSTIKAKLKNETQPSTKMFTDKFHETGSCFVSLHTRGKGKLRGCIGNIQAYTPLIENIISNAENSAFHDPRFAPVSSLEELENLEIEISVLTSPKKIDSIEEFTIGKHGIILSHSGHSAVFLPQVAPEQKWDIETTMQHLSMKARLQPDAWKEPEAEYSVFEAIVFSEHVFS